MAAQGLSVSVQAAVSRSVEAISDEIISWLSGRRRRKLSQGNDAHRDAPAWDERGRQ